MNKAEEIDFLFKTAWDCLLADKFQKAQTYLSRLSVYYTEFNPVQVMAYHQIDGELQELVKYTEVLEDADFTNGC
jgi:hypothetical protein